MTPKARAVILAAGESKRMQGAQKLLMPYRGKPMIDYVIEAAADWEPLVVAGPQVAAHLSGGPHLEVVLNEHPESGMAHSLRLAHAHIAAGVPFLVLLGDKPLVSARLIQRVFDEAEGADIAQPHRAGEPGHPVYFSAKARAHIEALPPGDSIRLLHEDPGLEYRTLDVDDPGAYFDIDERGGFEPPRE